MFSNLFLKSFRILLFPFSLLYWLCIAVRNFLYDTNILKSTGFALPLICAGNLSTGGTGKSPMVEYLVELLQHRFRIATLSRGYKRKTRGYALAGKSTIALEIGDEPMQFHRKYPDVPVAVGEERLVAIPQLLHDKPDTEVILLDDAFQHRAVKAGLNILLTDYNNLFTRDFYLPTGDLRDLKRSYKRAEIIIVTKCKENISAAEKAELITEINPVSGQKIYFTSIEYERPRHFISHRQIELQENTEVLLVTGIANPRPIKKMLEQHHNGYLMIQFPDHHIFTIDDWREIKKRFDAIKATDKIVLTTEKDAVRLEKFKPEIQDMPLYVIAIRHKFLFGEGELFNRTVIDFIEDFKKHH
ncbi:MAG: tetraacyldisaccharide 4'-kinase [Bacteroidetes bacterium]|nr:tetraacyldisaccharide 4'-kinase [Bacteroidota bacterium]